MCHLSTFHHLCGHIYLRTLISCPAAVDQAIKERFPKTTSTTTPQSLVLSSSSSACSETQDLESLSPISSSRCSLSEANDNDLESLESISPVFPLTSPTIQRLHPCKDVVNAPSIVPFSCEKCVELDNLSTKVAGPAEQRPTWDLIKTRKVQLQRGRGRARARSEVASPVLESIIESESDSDTEENEEWEDRAESGYFNGSNSGRVSSDGSSLYTASARSDGDTDRASHRAKSEDRKRKIASMRNRVLLNLRRANGNL